MTVYIHDVPVSFKPQHFRYIWSLTEFNPLKPVIRLNCRENASFYNTHNTNRSYHWCVGKYSKFTKNYKKKNTHTCGGCSHSKCYNRW